VDMISVEKEEFMLVIEAKRGAIGKAIRQCLVPMIDFITTGETWQMIEYAHLLRHTINQDYTTMSVPAPTPSDSLRGFCP